MPARVSFRGRVDSQDCGTTQKRYKTHMPHAHALLMDALFPRYSIRLRDHLAFVVKMVN